MCAHSVPWCCPRPGLEPSSLAWCHVWLHVHWSSYWLDVNLASFDFRGLLQPGPLPRPWPPSAPGEPVFWRFLAGWGSATSLTACCVLSSGEGVWSNQGCARTEGDLTYSVCHCTHLTNFAILMQVVPLQVRAGLGLRWGRGLQEQLCCVARGPACVGDPTLSAWGSHALSLGVPAASAMC